MTERALAQLIKSASPAAQTFVRRVLEQDEATQRWGAQLGPSLSQRDAARLLGKSEQAVAKDGRLLRLRNQDGRPVYPVVQFDGRRLLPGVAEIIDVLTGAVEPLTVASWLTAPNAQLGGRCPIDVLRDGEVAPALAVARSLASSAA